MHRCTSSRHGGSDCARNRPIPPSSAYFCAAGKRSSPRRHPEAYAAGTKHSRQFGAANSHRSTIRRPTNSSSPLAPKGPRRSIPISIAPESLHEPDHRNHMSFLSKSSPRAESTKVAAVRTAPRQNYRRLRHPIEKVARGAECFGAIKALRRSASRCHWSRLSMMRSITARWNFSICNRSGSIRNSFSSRRIIATGSDASALLHVGRKTTIYDLLESCVDYRPFSACG